MYIKCAKLPLMLFLRIKTSALARSTQLQTWHTHFPTTAVLCVTFALAVANDYFRARLGDWVQQHPTRHKSLLRVLHPAAIFQHGKARLVNVATFPHTHLSIK